MSAGDVNRSDTPGMSHLLLARHLSSCLPLPFSKPLLQVVNVLGFKLPFYKSATLLLSLGLSLRVLYYLFKQRPQVIHVSTPGVMCFAAGKHPWMAMEDHTWTHLLRWRGVDSTHSGGPIRHTTTRDTCACTCS